MDYIPPERPALIAQARDEERRPVYKIIDTGQIDQMDLLDDFLRGIPQDIKDARLRVLKPGQYVELCHAEATDDQLTFYVQEHKPCSVPTYAAFCALTKLDPANPEHLHLSEKQLGLIKEILGDKLDKTKFDLKAGAEILSTPGKNRRGLIVTTETRQKPSIIGSAYYLVSDPKSRVIEEVGFKGARKDNKYWLDEARSMFASAKFVKEGASNTQSSINQLPGFKHVSKKR